MESDWDRFTQAINERIDSKLLPVEQQLNYQQELINKLSKSLESVIESIQMKSGKKFEVNLLTQSSSGSISEARSKDNNLEELDEEKVENNKENPRESKDYPNGEES